MQAADNGCVAVTLEWGAATVRATLAVPGPADPRPPYRAVATVTRVSDRVCKLSALCGEVTRAHVWLLAQLLRAEGFRYLYAERSAAHVVPAAELIEAGDFAGFWRLDLETMQDRRKNRGAQCGS